ncbi:MAG: hypothetical protein O3A51_13260, partial [Verrucomicrobia bacterium]|nr:hypothetical protein [Verrucomicrobiota bacterium]
FSRNYAQSHGGAIYHLAVAPEDRPMTMQGCDFFENASRLHDGGAIYIDRDKYPDDIIRNCRFFANGGGTTRDGGAAMLRNFNGLIEDTIFSCNSALAKGGALYLNRSQPFMNRVIFVGNDADLGGAIYQINATMARLSITNGVLVGNRAKGQGGAIHSASGDSELTHCTFVDNRQTTDTSTNDGGGALNLAGGNHTVHNSILYRNRAFDLGDQVYLYASSTINISDTDLEGGTGAITDGGSATINNNGGIVTVNPQFSPVYSFGMTGTWTANAVYTNATGMAVLTDGNAAWAPDMLVGAFLNPNTNADNRAFLIVGNDQTTITILGCDTNAFAGDAYQIRRYDLQAGSPLVSQASTKVAAADVNGSARPQGAGAELGAYEVVPDAVDPDAISGLSAVAALDQVTLAWTNPASADYRGVLVLCRAGAAPTGTPADATVYQVGNNIGDGTIAYIGDGGNLSPTGMAMWVHAPLDHETTYHYAVFALDPTPNYAAGVAANATTPSDAIAPAPVTSLVVAGAEGQINLSWINSVSPDNKGVLILRRTGATAPTGTPTPGVTYIAGNAIGDGTVVYVGPASGATPGGTANWSNTGLPDLTKYSYCVFAYDERPNYATSECDDASTSLPGVIFVNDDATGSNNGNGWEDAFTDLQDALRAAGSGDEIWIAEGIYLPTNGTAQTARFYLKPNVTLYGGFVGNEVNVNNRDWMNNQSVLSGNIGSVGSSLDNCDRVVEAANGAADGAVMDGLVVTGADGSLTGAGMYAGSVVTVRNCIFEFNVGNEAGGIHSDKASLFEQIIFRYNQAANRGSAFQTYSQTPTLRNCLFYGNTCGGRGTISAYHAASIFEHCTFVQNSAARANAIYASNGGAVAAYNCIFWDTNAGELDFGGGLSPKQPEEPNQGTIDVFDSDVRGGYTPPANGSCTDCIDVDPQFTDSGTGDFSLLVTSPCIDAGGVLA